MRLILILACVQVFVLKGHLFAMLGVAGIQAFLAVRSFMHLGSEKPILATRSDSWHIVCSRDDEYDLGR